LSPDPLDVPWSGVDYLAGQLGIANPSVVKRYTDRRLTAYEHAWEIRRAYGYRDFADEQASAQLREFLAGRAWTHAEDPVALVGQAVAWLRRHRVLLPGVSILAPAGDGGRTCSGTVSYVKAVRRGQDGC
jgi:hypothetical protein